MADVSTLTLYCRVQSKSTRKSTLSEDMVAKTEHLEILRRGVDAWNAWRKEDDIWRLTPNLRGADLHGLNLYRADLAGVNLSGADLSGTELFHTDFSMSKLKKANLRRAQLYFANFNQADLSGADLTRAELSYTLLAGTNLSGAKGLDNCIHHNYSTLDHQTLIRSGTLPLDFLHGCGLPEALIRSVPTLLNDPLEFYSCFISFSGKDQEFADRLHAELQSKGVRVWFAPHDMSIGAHIRPTIDKSISAYDKLLLVLSENSVNSQWVEQEVETALRKERLPGINTVLFPIRLDDSILEIGEGWPALIKDTRHIGDFTDWQNPESYQRALGRLLRDLQAVDE